MFILDCTESIQMCCNMQPFLKIVDFIITLIQISVPIVIIVLGTIDMVKAVISTDDKVISSAKSSLIKRIIFGVIIFIVPYLLQLILEFAERFIINPNLNSENEFQVTSTNYWVSCWNSIINDDLDCSTCNIYEDDNESVGESTSDGNLDVSEDTKVCYLYKMGGLQSGSSSRPSITDDNKASLYSCRESIYCGETDSVQSSCEFEIEITLD